MTDRDYPTVEEVRRHWGLAVDIHRRDERLAGFDRLIEQIRADAYARGKAVAQQLTSESSYSYQDGTIPPGTMTSQELSETEDD